MSLKYNPSTTEHLPNSSPLFSLVAQVETMHTTSTPPADNVVKITLAPKHVGAIVAMAKNLKSGSADKSWRQVKQLLKSPDEIASLLNAIPQKFFRSPKFPFRYFHTNSTLEQLRKSLQTLNLDTFQSAQALALHWHFSSKDIAKMRKIINAKAGSKRGKIFYALSKVLTFNKQAKIRAKDDLFAFGMDFSIQLALLRPTDNEIASRRLGVERNMLTSTMTGIKIGVESKIQRMQVKFSIQDVQAWDTYTPSPVFPSIFTRAKKNDTRPVFSVSYARDPNKGRKLNISVRPLHVNVNFPYLERLVNECTLAEPALSAIRTYPDKLWLSQVSAAKWRKCVCTDG